MFSVEPNAQFVAESSNNRHQQFDQYNGVSKIGIVSFVGPCSLPLMDDELFVLPVSKIWNDREWFLYSSPKKNYQTGQNNTNEYETRRNRLKLIQNNEKIKS